MKTHATRPRRATRLAALLAALVLAWTLGGSRAAGDTPFQVGEFVTYDQAYWGDRSSVAGALVDYNLDLLFRVIEFDYGFQVGLPPSAGFRLEFYASQDVYDYLPAYGAPGVLTSSSYGPYFSTESGIFGGDTTALKLNVDFSAAGVIPGTGGRFGDLVLCRFTTSDPFAMTQAQADALNGQTIVQFLAEAQTVLGGGTGTYGLTLLQLDSLTVKLNLSFDRGGVVNPFAQAHLCRAGDTVGNTGSLATGRQWHTATLLQSGKVLVAGGYNSPGAGVLSSAELYDPALGTWSATGPLATRRLGHTATLLPNGKVFVAGGYGSDTAELYDPATGTWSATGSLATGRGAHTATLLPGGQVLVVGGINTTSGFAIASAELYDPAGNGGAGSWNATGSLATARASHTATLLANGKVLVTGGADANGPFSSAELYDPASGAWSAAGSFATARSNHTATLLPTGSVLVAGGLNNLINGGFLGLASAAIYDPASGAWSATGSLATGRGTHTATLLPNGKVLVAGGSANGVAARQAELYDPASGIWSPRDWPLGVARSYHTATLLPGGQVLVAGGAIGGGIETLASGPTLASAQINDPAIAAWSATGSLASARRAHTATLLPSGKVLAAGGYVPGSSLSSAALYDPAIGMWSATGSLPESRTFHTATLLTSGKVLVAGGENDVSPYVIGSASLYDPATAAWTATGSLGTARASHIATLLPSGKVLVAGGADILGAALASAELFDPAGGSNGAWSATGALAKSRAGPTATLLPGGKVLVAGGANATGYLSSAELYDPASGTWSTTGPLATARDQHTATLLPNGRVLVVGGYNFTGFLSAAELYDPALGTWSATGSLGTPRLGHTATLLPNGKVLVAGGSSATGVATAGGEIYDPASGMWSPAYSHLGAARYDHTATFLPNGRVLFAGGIGGSNNTTYLSSAELYDVGLGFSAAWQPQISAASLNPTDRLVLAGTRFRGISSASGGNGGQDSPTSYPVVQLRWLDNGQSVFLLSDPAANVSATAFTSAPVAGRRPGYAQVTVFANGIPSAAFVLPPPAQDIIVEQPVGSVITDGDAKDFGTTAPSTPVSVVFTIKNVGTTNLTGLTIAKDGANAADFTVTASPTAPVTPGGSTTFTVQFGPTGGATGTRTAAIHIANNVAGAKNPFDITLTGLALSYTSDTDGDGLSDAAEFDLAALGFNWQVSQPALVNTYYARANEAGLYTAAQVQALNVDVPMIQRNATTGQFKLTLGLEKSTNLSVPNSFVPFPFTGAGTVINGQGKIEFLFTVPDNAAFFRVQAQ